LGALLDLARQAREAEPPPAVRYTTGSREAEMRRLLEAIAKANPRYWPPEEVEFWLAVCLADLDAALMAYRDIAKGYGLETH
jgi:hypothetical protein